VVAGSRDRLGGLVREYSQVACGDGIFGTHRPSTSQFRRTLAWFIARQPGGVIAGSMAYRHHRVQMFEGYAGTSASGFRAEVEAEDAIARGEQLCDLVTSHGQHPLTGPAAGEAEARLADLQRHVTFDGKAITDARRLRRIMDRHDPRIYPGQHVTCVYNPDRALCRRGGDATGPSLPDCQPLACRNVVLTSGNIAALTLHRAQLEQALERGSVIAPYVRHRLEGQLSEMTAFPRQARPTAAEGTMRRHLPPDEQVKAAMACVLAQAGENGRKVTVTAVERALGIPHATFDRNYRHLIEDFRQRAHDQSVTAKQAVMDGEYPAGMLAPSVTLPIS